MATDLIKPDAFVCTRFRILIVNAFRLGIAYGGARQIVCSVIQWPWADEHSRFEDDCYIHQLDLSLESFPCTPRHAFQRGAIYLGNQEEAREAQRRTIPTLFNNRNKQSLTMATLKLPSYCKEWINAETSEK